MMRMRIFVGIVFMIVAASCGLVSSGALWLAMLEPYDVGMYVTRMAALPAIIVCVLTLLFSLMLLLGDDA